MRIHENATLLVEAAAIEYVNATSLIGFVSQNGLGLTISNAGCLGVALPLVSNLNSTSPHDLPNIAVSVSELSAPKAAEELNARGKPTPVGGKWHATQVIRIRESLAQD